MKDGAGHFYGHADVSRDIAAKVLGRLRFGNKITDEVLFLIENHGIVINDDTRSIRRGLARYGEQGFLDLIKVHYYDTCGKAPEYFCEKELFDSIREHTLEFLENEPPMSLSKLNINGSDVAALGFNGKAIGEALRFALSAVIDGVCKNEKDELISILTEKNR